LDFLNAYGIYIYPAFVIGIILHLIGKISMALIAFSIAMFVMYFVMGFALYAQIAVASLIFAFVAKYLGI
jgi:hypothetical protein